MDGHCEAGAAPAAIADYAAVGGGAPAPVAALASLMDALAGGFTALAHPVCAALLGPVVPGATMVHGARVPGTSWELDPVMAAFNIALLLRWPDPQRTACAAQYPAGSLGALLAVCDYLARRAHHEGREPCVVRDLLAALERAQAIQSALGMSRGGAAPACGPVAAARVASTAVAAHLLGASRAQLAAAVATALQDGGEGPAAPDDDAACASLAAADAAARGVRLALRARRAAVGEGFAAAAGALRPAIDLRFEPPGAAVLAATTALAVERRFEAVVIAHFGTRQAAAICARFADRPRLWGMPVHELMAILVKNG